MWTHLPTSVLIVMPTSTAVLPATTTAALQRRGFKNRASRVMKITLAEFCSGMELLTQETFGYIDNNYWKNKTKPNNSHQHTSVWKRPTIIMLRSQSEHFCHSTCMRARARAHTHTHTHARVHTHTHTHTHTHKHACTHTHTSTSEHSFFKAWQ